MIGYFAYGSNLDVAAMRRRCRGARLVGSATLAGHRFAIVRPGFATVLPACGGAVYGLLWALTPRDLVALHIYESVASGLYRVAWRPVRTAGGMASALVYIARSRVPARPRIDYLDGIMAAIATLCCPAVYRRKLLRTAGVPRPVRRRRALR